jgi:hypothetical protein
MNEYWFVPKQYGYGATPVTWEGWVVAAIFLAIVIALVLIVPRRKKAGLSNKGPLIALFASTAVFIWICAVKTNGDWSWRWGQTGPQIELEGSVA